MKITKFGHCCLLIEENGVKVLTDPGSYSTLQNDAKDVDVIVITHEHQDHLHVDSLKEILVNNPDAKIVTNSSVNNILKKENINDAIIVEDGQSGEVAGIKIAGHGTIHAEIFREWPSVQNTGYFIGERIFYPGDAFYNPKIPVDILAWPAAGPWLKISEALDYALEVKPKVLFPVHDGMLNENGGGLLKRLGESILEKNGIKFVVLEIGKETEL
jgi:L-ascorbate metabolism protein UlaG (beta-lactamase superfamily)